MIFNYCSMVFYILDQLIRIQQSHTPVCFWNWCKPELLRCLPFCLLLSNFHSEMALFFHLQLFFDILPLLASPCHSFQCCSSVLPPSLFPSSILCLHLMRNDSLGLSPSWEVRCSGSVFQDLFNWQMPTILQSTGTFSSRQALALRASPSGALSGALPFFLGTRSSGKPAHLLTFASNNCGISIQLQATEWSWPKNCSTHSDHQGYYCVWNTAQMQVGAQMLEDQWRWAL